MKEAEEIKTKHKKGDVINFYTYEEANRVIKGTIVKVFYNLQFGEYYSIKPKEKFTDSNVVTRTYNEIKLIN